MTPVGGCFTSQIILWQVACGYYAISAFRLLSADKDRRLGSSAIVLKRVWQLVALSCLRAISNAEAAVVQIMQWTGVKVLIVCLVLRLASWCFSIQLQVRPDVGVSTRSPFFVQEHFKPIAIIW